MYQAGFAYQYQWRAVTADILLYKLQILAES